MFTSPAPAAPTLSTSTSPASPTSPTRSGRLRGLSYLRSYTHNHIQSRIDSNSSRPSVTRSRTSPLSESPQDATSRSRHRRNTSGSASTPRRTAQEEPSAGAGVASPPSESTSGWLPTTSRTSLSRVTTRPPAIETGSPGHSDLPLALAAVHSARGASGPLMVRNRAEPAAANLDMSSPNPPASTEVAADDVESPATKSTQKAPSIKLIPHQDPRAPRPSLSFSAITRTLPSSDTIIRVGRYSERENRQEQSASTIGFKSKVVSRKHCELWCTNSQWYIKDVKSSSGTFLNHIRLSQPGVESKPFPLSDGDIVQLGIDFRGGEEMIFRCVKMRVECNRGWQKGLNNFNKNTHKRLRNLGKAKDVETASTHTSECSICLMSIAPCQSLFVAPCSHVWHYKCIRPILNGSTWPNFLCPNCRAVADLEADVDDPVEFEDMDDVVEESLLGDNNQSEVHGETTRIASSPAPAAHPASSSEALVAGLLAATNIHDDDDIPGIDTPEEEDENDEDDEDENDAQQDGGPVHSTSTSAPIPISSPSRSPRSHSNTDPSNRMSSPETTGTGLASTPSNRAQYALAANDSNVQDGPMTPRNDHGPFVLDGSGTRSRRPTTMESLDGIAGEQTRSDGTDSS